MAIYTLFTGKTKINNNQVISHHFSHVYASFWLGNRTCSNWCRNLIPMYQTNPVYDTHTRNQHQKNGVEL